MPGLSSRRRLLLAASAAVSCGWRKKAIRLGSVNPDSMLQLPVITAEQMGYFRRQGIDTQLDALPSGARGMLALLGGSTDVMATIFDQVLLMAAENRGIRSFLLMERCPMLAVVVSPVVRKTIKRMADLKGCMIGVTSPGSSTHLLLNYMLTRSGVDPQEVSAVGLGSNAARVATLESGKLDAAVLGDPGVTLLERRYPNLVLLADTRTPEGARQAFGSDAYPGAVLFAREQWLHENRDRALRLTTAVLGAMKWIRETPAAGSDAAHTPPVSDRRRQRVHGIGTVSCVRAFDRWHYARAIT